jgi:hypothetical protein
MAEISGSACRLVPGDSPGNAEARRKLLHEILETYISLGLLTNPTEKGLFARFSRSARHPLADQIDLFIR